MRAMLVLLILAMSAPGPARAADLTATRHAHHAGQDLAVRAQYALAVGLGLGRVLERVRRLLHCRPRRLSQARRAGAVPASDRPLRSLLPEPMPDAGRAASARSPGFLSLTMRR